MEKNILTLDFCQDTVIYEGKTYDSGTLGCDSLNISQTVIDRLNGLCVGHAPKKCPICGRWFLTTNARHTKYCGNLAPGDKFHRTCRQIGNLKGREQTLLEKRLAICMACGRVSSWKGRPTFERLAVMFEGSTASGAERAYRKAVDKLTELLVSEGALHAVRLKRTARKKHNSSNTNQ